MAVNYVLDTTKIKIRIEPGDFPTVRVEFMLSTPTHGLVEEIGGEVRDAIVGIGEKSLQITQVREDYQRCFFCGTENHYDQDSCVLCGKSV